MTLDRDGLRTVSVALVGRHYSELLKDGCTVFRERRDDGKENASLTTAAWVYEVRLYKLRSNRRLLEPYSVPYSRTLQIPSVAAALPAPPLPPLPSPSRPSPYHLDQKQAMHPQLPAYASDPLFQPRHMLRRIRRRLRTWTVSRLN